MYKILVLPPPLRVTLPPPSITISFVVLLNTFAGSVRIIVTGSLPQLNVIIPPLATASVKAFAEQLSFVPPPTICVGFETSFNWPSFGIAHLPSGFPADMPLDGFVGTESFPSLFFSSLHEIKKRSVIKNNIACFMTNRLRKKLLFS